MAGQQYHGEVQALDAQRKRDLEPPHIHVFAALLRVARDCLALLTPPPRHGSGFDELQDEIGTSLERRGGKTGLGREAVEDATARSDKDTAEDHGRGNANSGVPEPYSLGGKALYGSGTSFLISRGCWAST